MASETEIINRVYDSTVDRLKVTSIGDVGSGATDSGNPIKVAGVYNTSPPSFTNGQRANLQTDSQGRLKVTIPPLSSSTDSVATVGQVSTTGTPSTVASSATNTTLLASNSSRMGATITNESTAVLYVKFGATASLTSYAVTLAGSSTAPYAYLEVPFRYSGIIDGIWASANGNARVTELT